MKVLIAEYTASRDPTLAPEGKAMVSVLQESFERLGHTVVLPESGDFDAEIARLAPQCDYGLVIAPDEMLSKFTHTLELATHNIGSDSTSIAVCANKRLTGKILSGIGIAVPQEVGADYTGKRVIKPVKGAGSVGVRIAKEGEVPGDGEMAVEYLEGEHYSVSIVGSQAVDDFRVTLRGLHHLPNLQGLPLQSFLVHCFHLLLCGYVQRLHCHCAQRYSPQS